MARRSIFGRRRKGRGSDGAASPFLRYRVDCRCGHTLEGEREKTYQVVACPDCGVENFILPLNPRAMPAGATRQTVSAEASAQRDSDQQSLSEAATPAPTEAPRPTKRRRRRRSRPPVGDAPREAAPAPPPADEPDEPVAERSRRIRRAAQRHRRVTRSRLIVAVIVLLVVVTSFVTWRSARRARYARNLEHDTAAGYAALVDADFVGAERLLNRAHQGAVGLGDDTPAARRAIQLHRESLLWKSLLAHDVDELLAALSTASGRKADNQAWQSVFDKSFRGRNVIISTELRPYDEDDELAGGGEVSEGEGGDDAAAPAHPQYLCDWSVRGDGVEIRLALGDAAALRQVPLKGRQQVIIGGEIAGLSPDSEQANLWWLRLVDDSCTLVTVAAPLTYYGWPDDDTLSKQLAEQSKWLKIEGNEP